MGYSFRFRGFWYVAMLSLACSRPAVQKPSPPVEAPSDDEVPRREAALPASSPEAKLEQPPRLNLSAAPLIVVPAPRWKRTRPPRDAITPGALSKRSPRLVKISSRAASPTRNMDLKFDPAKPFFIPPIDKGAVPDNAPRGIPSSYATKYLSAIIPNDPKAGGTKKTFLIYAGRFLTVVEGNAAVRIFDLEAFRIPPRARPQWREFSTQGLTYVQERDGVLYLCNGGGSYAREVYGKKGFLSAINAKTGALIWRSRPLTCNATFAMTDTHIISGYGFTDEPDYVFLVRRTDGRIVRKVRVATGPDFITLEGNRIHVETYGHVVKLELR